VTYTNINIPRESDIRARQYREAVEKERDFWLKEAESLRDQLENVFHAAQEHGFVELSNRGETMHLYTWQKAAELDAPLS
jgi:hypothetical protein